ncbi:unnamed protein product [Mytilus coruscus]|uniref:B box-type domain-containing protein n=1 Tax=Mytilus coruscus TaxID=42192 RepID=A0A6J8DKW1_MYTCO|nr:unnamed protein product [Mytilus coruscus]
MASGKHIPCGPCSFDDVTKDAGRWCTNCEEGLCEDCEHVHRKSKSSRNHRVISIEDYRKIENVSISQVCEHHGENLEWFCKSHDEVLCVVCVPSKHKACSDVIPISPYSENSRQSTALSELEETIEGTLRNVKQCIKNRESATKEIENQELAVKTMIFETRTKINGKLDKLQEKLLHELRSTSDKCKSEYMKIIQKLKSTEEMLTKLREQTIHMKQFSSDIKVFLGTRQADKLIKSEVESLKSEIHVTKDYGLKVDIHSLIEKLSSEVENFGQIKVTECNAINFDFRDPKIDQAQIKINVPASRNISDIKLQLIKTFTISRANEMIITGCVILPNGHILVANYKPDNHLIEYSDSGEHIRDIPVSSMPYDIALIDPSRIVVTYGDASFLEIMNSNTFSVEKKICLQESCLGVSHEDGKLYIIHGHSVLVLDYSGRKIKTMKTASMHVTCMYASRDRIVYSDWKNNKVHCCNLNGEELWQFENDSIKFPRAVQADNHNNVYVVGYVSNNLTIIQYDGKDSRTLLKRSDGLNRPNAVFFDKDKRKLLICNKDGNVASYKVI